MSAQEFDLEKMHARIHKWTSEHAHESVREALAVCEPVCRAVERGEYPLAPASRTLRAEIDRAFATLTDGRLRPRIVFVSASGRPEVGDVYGHARIRNETSIAWHVWNEIGKSSGCCSPQVAPASVDNDTWVTLNRVHENVGKVVLATSLRRSLRNGARTATRFALHASRWFRLAGRIRETVASIQYHVLGHAQLLPDTHFRRIVPLASVLRLTLPLGTDRDDPETLYTLVE